jgi:hypothetical protein
VGGKDFLVKNKNYIPKKQTNCIFILSLSVFFSFFFKKDFLSKISWKIEKFIDPLYSFFAPLFFAPPRLCLGGGLLRTATLFFAWVRALPKPRQKMGRGEA